MKNKKTFYITTPIFYPSGKLHIGHLFTATIAQFLKNYKTLCGYDSKLLTGIDEHGKKIEEAARKNNLNPKEYVKKMSENFKNFWKAFQIDFDFFSHTTDLKHIETIKKSYLELAKQNLITKGKYSGLYSVEDEEFVTKTQAKKVNDKYLHPVSGHELVKINENALYFNCKKYLPFLNKFLSAKNNVIFPEKTVNELKRIIEKKDFEKLAISRKDHKWAIKIPGKKELYFYVWFDALFNYVSALGFKSQKNQDYKKYWENGDEIVHVIGKEIARFHCLYWPSFLKVLNLKLPNKIIAHSWIMTPTGKMSKSKKNIVDPLNLLNEYNPEEIKVFLLYEIDISKDGIFETSRLKNFYNAQLANNFGNLISRTLTMINKNFNSPLVYSLKALTKDDKSVLANILNYFDQYKTYVEKSELKKAITSAFDLSNLLNKYIDETKAWTLTNNKERLEVILNIILNGIYAVAAMLSPIMPKKMDEVLVLLQMKEANFKEIKIFSKFDKITCKKSKVIFKRKK